MKLVLGNIDDNDLAGYIDDILTFRPVPVDMDGNPTMNNSAWVKELGKEFYKGLVKGGRERKRKINNPVTVPDFIT